jgi:outer membrane protein OmpA-like peptidoglycan-associated protein
MKLLAHIVVLLIFIAGTLTAQRPAQPAPVFTTDSRWSLGFHGGANLWINDFNTRRFAPGGDFMFRYGLSRRFSLGVTGGFDRLIAIQFPNDPALSPTLPQRTPGYLALNGVHGNLLVWYHFPPTMEIRPYIYVGVGSMWYTRQDRTGIHLPDSAYKVNTTIHIPAGFGFEIPVSRSFTFNFDFGARLMDDYTDQWKGHVTPNQPSSPGVFDWYPTGRAGFNIYFGGSDSDDDDGDGLTNDEERKYGTNPYRADSDGDGLKDGDEIWRHNTNPLKSDTDADLLTDGDEVLKYLTFPNKPDSDGDGLFDGDEVLKHDTNPMRPDTDGDGLTDSDEVRKHGTNPSKADTDGDTLTDGDELVQYKTDPRNKDTDNGSVDDGTEVKRGTNPLDPRDDTTKKELKTEVGKAVVLEGIVFRTGSAVITKVSEEILTLALNTLVQNPDMTVEIRGHTDDTGSRRTNDVLSQRRADAVKQWLVNRGVAASRIRAVGYGQDYPIDTNLTKEGRQRNRRIEFYRTR